MPDPRDQTLELTATIDREGEGFVAICRELDIASQGLTTTEAFENLREAVELFLETAERAEIGQRLRSSPHTGPTSIHPRPASPCSLGTLITAPGQPPRWHPAQEEPGSRAVQWHAQGLISQEKAAEIAGLSRADLLEELFRRKVPASQATFEDLIEEIEHE